MVDVFPKYTYTKSGTYYFSKTVPRDLKPHYTRNRIIICLKRDQYLSLRGCCHWQLVGPLPYHSLQTADRDQPHSFQIWKPNT